MIVPTLALALALAQAPPLTIAPPPAREAPAARPDWVGGMPAAFPRERWVTAEGSGDDRAAAESRARAGVAAFFESRVSASTRVREAEARRKAGFVELRASAQAVEQEVAATSARLLEGVEIADAWTDPATGRVHALAALDRGRAVETLRRRLAEVDAEVAAIAKRLAAEPARLGRASLGFRLATAAARRGPVADELRLLDPAAEPAPPPEALAARAAAEKALAEVAVLVHATGEGSASAAAAATRAALAAGLRAAAGEAGADLLATVAVEAAPLDVDPPWTSARLTARVRLATPQGEAWATFAETAKGTSGKAEEASRRARAALATRIEERLHAEIRSRLEGK